MRLLAVIKLSVVSNLHLYFVSINRFSLYYLGTLYIFTWRPNHIEDSTSVILGVCDCFINALFEFLASLWSLEGLASLSLFSLHWRTFSKWKHSSFLLWSLTITEIVLLRFPCQVKGYCFGRTDRSR